MKPCRRLQVIFFWSSVLLGHVATLVAQQPSTPTAADPGSARRSAAEVYQAACATCHGPDGKGSPRAVVGFEVPLPDFTDCAFATAEPDPDWYAVVHEGGPVRALDRHMPAFGDALSSEEIHLAISHVRTFCREERWPRGDLNLPRAFFTEKAFPENEAVWTTSISTADQGSVENTLVYERRFGARNQVEVVVPIAFAEGVQGEWTRGLGDVAFAFKRTLHANLARGQISAAGVEVVLPTGDADRGLGNGYTVIEPFAMWGQVLPRNLFTQFHIGAELPTDGDAVSETYARAAFGGTVAADRGFGRAWSPQIEVLWARPHGESSEWDVVPQFQVTLSKLQHVMIAAGVRVPLNKREERRPQALVYLLWDWFDGGFFEMWR